MATKERAHQLIDALPDTPEGQLQLDSVVHQLEPSGASVAEESKPGDIIDDWGNLSAMKRRSARRTMRRIGQEEADAGLERW